MATTMAEIWLSIPEHKVKDILRVIGYADQSTHAKSNGKVNGKVNGSRQPKVWGVATKIVMDAAANGGKFSSKDLARRCQRKGLTKVAYVTPLNRMIEQGKITRLTKGSKGNPSLYKAA